MITLNSVSKCSIIRMFLSQLYNCMQIMLKVTKMHPQE